MPVESLSVLYIANAMLPFLTYGAHHSSDQPKKEIEMPSAGFIYNIILVTKLCVYGLYTIILYFIIIYSKVTIIMVNMRSSTIVLNIQQTF